MSGQISDRLLLAIEADSQLRKERVRAMLQEAGRPDLLAEFDQNMKDVATGVSAARSQWQSLSREQRRILRALVDDKSYCTKITTIHALEKRGMVSTSGRERSVTELGKFVVRFGSA